MSGTTFFLCMVMVQMDYSYAQTRLACELMPLIEQESYNADIDPGLVIAIIHSESSWRPNLVSPGGACGLMQIDPRENPAASGEVDTCDDLKDPSLNIRVGIALLKKWIDLAEGHIPLGICAYDAGFSCFTDPQYQYLEGVATVYDRFMSEVVALGGSYDESDG